MTFIPRRLEQRLKASALKYKEQRNKDRFYKNEQTHTAHNIEHTSCDQENFEKHELAHDPARVMDDAMYVNNILEKTRTLLNKHKETN